MNAYIVLPAFLLGLVIVQTSFLETLFFDQIGIEITLLFVIYAGFHMEPIKGSILSFILGLFMDCLTMPISGLYTFVYTFIFSITMLVSPRVYKSHVPFIMGFTFASALLEALLLAFLYRLLYDVDVMYSTLVTYAPRILILTLLSPLFFNLFNRWEVFSRDPVKQSS